MPLVERRLRELSWCGDSVELELSRLEFIDCAGIRILMDARAEAEANGWRLVFRGELTPPVRRMFELLGEDLLPDAA